MIDKIFDTLSTKKLSNEDKLIGIKMLFEHTLEKFTADDGKIYATAYENYHCLNEEEVAAMPVSEIDDIVYEETMDSDDLFLSLLLLKNFSTMNWGATEASFIHKDGVATFKVVCGDQSFEKTFNIELD